MLVLKANIVHIYIWSDRNPGQPGALLIGWDPCVSMEIMADLVLDSAATRQLVAVSDGDYDGRFKEKGIPALWREEKRRFIIHLQTIAGKPMSRLKIIKAQQ